MIIFDVIDSEFETKSIEIPKGIKLSLMEVLRASEYPILATCEGMALCGTCIVEVEKGVEKLQLPNDAELDMLDSLPIVSSLTRLSCQINIDDTINGAVFILPTE
jgi:2Fe-2S ferredoxin